MLTNFKLEYIVSKDNESRVKSLNFSELVSTLRNRHFDRGHIIPTGSYFPLAILDGAKDLHYSKDVVFGKPIITLVALTSPVLLPAVTVIGTLAHPVYAAQDTFSVLKS